MSGTNLKVNLEAKLNRFITMAQAREFEANLLVSACWSTKDNLVLRFHGPVNDAATSAILDAMKARVRKESTTMDTNVVEGIRSPSPSNDIRLLNKPPTTLLKFLSVVTLNSDGTTVTEDQLLEDVKAHLAWESVTLWSPPKFLVKKGQELGHAHMVVVSVEDDVQGSVGKSLMCTTVCFASCGGCTCFCWITKTNVCYNAVRTPTLCIPDTSDRHCYFLLKLPNLAMPL